MQYTTSQSLLDLVTFGGIGHVTGTTIEFDNITALDGYNIDNFTINPDGTITVHGGTEPGEYVFTYTLCPTGSTTGCADVTCTITINTTIRANADIFYYGTSGTYYGSAETINTPNIGVANIITNDGYAADCGLNAPNSFTPAVLDGNVSNLYINPSPQTSIYFTFNNLTGEVNSNGSDTGSFPFSYTICDLFNPSICSTVNCWISVIQDNYKMANTFSAENNINSVTVFPNPTNNIVNISFLNQVATLKVEVYNILGQKLLEQNDNQTDSTFIDLSNLSTSSYLLKISHDNEVLEKLIIKN
jgi:hypothetical protein